MFRHHIDMLHSCEICYCWAFGAGLTCFFIFGCFWYQSKHWWSGAGSPSWSHVFQSLVAHIPQSRHLYLFASIHQADQSFLIESREKQCIMMSLLALICEQLLPIQWWTTEIHVLVMIRLQGDVMYWSTICEVKISANNSLSVLDLSNIASFLVGEHVSMFLTHWFSHWEWASYSIKLKLITRNFKNFNNAPQVSLFTWHYFKNYINCWLNKTMSSNFTYANP